MQEYSRGGSVRWEAVIAVGVANADFEPSDHTGLNGALEPGPHLKRETLSERLEKNIVWIYRNSQVGAGPV